MIFKARSGIYVIIVMFGLIYFKEDLKMEELIKQVKIEMLRTLIWFLIACGAGVLVYYSFLVK